MVRFVCSVVNFDDSHIVHVCVIVWPLVTVVTMFVASLVDLEVTKEFKMSEVPVDDVITFELV